MSTPTKIDVHHHFVPDFFAKAITSSGGDPSGWFVPAWSADASAHYMEQVGASTAILSLTAPGAEVVQEREAQAQFARKVNEYVASIRDAEPSKFGFFATLPSLLYTEEALAEIEYALDVLKADGVTLFTRYGDGNAYLGDPRFRPVWKMLDERKAVVFVHPTHPVDIQPVILSLPQPVIDYPQETTRTALDLILSGTKSSSPNVKIILSHAGGTLPYLTSRISHLLPCLPQAPGMTPKSVEDIEREARSYYFDLALSCSELQLRALIDFAGPDHILYGSDFPYAPADATIPMNKVLDEFQMENSSRNTIYRGTALTLFPRLSAE